jgi:hypothetical protein
LFFPGWLAQMRPNQKRIDHHGALVTDETGWLIEMAEGPPAYWAAVPDPRAIGGFDPDVNKATRFSRKKDAEDMALFLHVKGAQAFVEIHRVRITEHMWTDASQSQRPGVT